jgi:DNA-binding CsgD family transcriptional regulator
MSQLVTLTNRHYEIMNRLLEGQKLEQIADAMGMSRPYMRVIIGSKLFKEELAKRRELRDRGVLKRMEDLSQESLDVIRDLMREGGEE